MSPFKIIHQILVKKIQQIINRFLAIIQKIQITLQEMIQILIITLLAIINLLQKTILTHQT
jgi:hypothetical protein